MPSRDLVPSWVHTLRQPLMLLGYYYPTAVTFQYVSSYCDYTFSTCDRCVLSASNCNYDCYYCCHLHVVSSTFGSVFMILLPTTDPKGHSEGCCWPHNCAAVAIWGALSGVQQLYHGSFSDHFFLELSLLPISLWLCLLWCCFLLSGSDVANISPMGAQPLGFAPL